VKDILKESILPSTPTEAYKIWATSQGLKEFFEADNNLKMTLGEPFII
jgi:hypothetical protein